MTHTQSGALNHDLVSDHQHPQFLSLMIRISKEEPISDYLLKLLPANATIIVLTMVSIDHYFHVLIASLTGAVRAATGCSCHNDAMPFPQGALLGEVQRWN